MNNTAARFPVAASVSPEARTKLEGMRAFLATLPAPALPITPGDFDTAAARAEMFAVQLTKAAIDALAPLVSERAIGGVATLDLTPSGHVEDDSILVYIHGGGFVSGSARANLLTGALAAATSWRRVISIDYTIAPRGTWDTILDQVVAVWTGLIGEGCDPAKMGLFGDSAGGCIAAAAALLLRSRAIAPPAAMILLSPVVDLHGEGDTTVTLAPADYLDASVFVVARQAYAPAADLTNPLVSPIFGDFSLGFPPVLIQVGTRELLLSDSVRLHRALRAAGQSSQLEVYEGMPHVFQPLLADAPEGKAAWSEMAAFWSEHLG